MWLPGTQTDPTEVKLAALADHVIAAPILLDRHVTLGTLARVRCDPIGCLRVVVALLDPPLKPLALHWVVPVLSTGKTEGVTTGTGDWFAVWVLHFDYVATVGRGAPV